MTIFGLICRCGRRRRRERNTFFARVRLRHGGGDRAQPARDRFRGSEAGYIYLTAERQMRFEVSERIVTTTPAEEIEAFLEAHLKKIADKVWWDDRELKAKGIEASFGSINRTDDTSIHVQNSRGAYLLVSETHYRPSFVFWLFFIAALFTYVGWIIPIVFYFHQRGSVKSAIESLMTRVRHEFEHSGTAGLLNDASPDYIDKLQSIAQLHERGFLTDDEFEREKRKLLGNDAIGY